MSLVEILHTIFLYILCLFSFPSVCRRILFFQELVVFLVKDNILLLIQINSKDLITQLWVTVSKAYL